MAGIANDRKGPLFRSARGKTGQLTDEAMSRIDVWRIVRRRAADAEIKTAIGCHTFRATGITHYLKNDGRIEIAQRMAGHSNAKTTGLLVMTVFSESISARESGRWYKCFHASDGADNGGPLRYGVVPAG